MIKTKVISIANYQGDQKFTIEVENSGVLVGTCSFILPSSHKKGKASYDLAVEKHSFINAKTMIEKLKNKDSFVTDQLNAVFTITEDELLGNTKV